VGLPEGFDDGGIDGGKVGYSLVKTDGMPNGPEGMVDGPPLEIDEGAIEGGTAGPGVTSAIE
jgi:hypothetical protein